MVRRPPRATRTDTLFPYTTLFRSSPAFPSAIGAGKQRRAHHLFGADGRGVFVALDHAAYMGSGPPLGQPMIDIGAAAPDSVLATWHVARAYPGVFADADRKSVA